MSEIDKHVSLRGAARSLLTSRFSRHPERYLQIVRVTRKYELHHVLAEFGRMAHQHEEEDALLAPVDHDEDDDHPENLASALEELGPCLMKHGQVLSTRPDLLPADYIDALSRLQSKVVPADTYLDMIEIPRDFDRRAFTQDVCALVSRYHDMSGGRMALGTALLDLTKVATLHRTPVPTTMTLLGKTMLNLDGTIRVLSPELDPVELIREYMQEVMEARVAGQTSPGRMSAWVLDMKRLVENSPRRADVILDKLAGNQLTLRLEPDEDALRGLQRAAGRLSTSVIAGSLIIAGGYVLGSLLRASANGHGRGGTLTRSVGARRPR